VDALVQTSDERRKACDNVGLAGKKAITPTSLNGETLPAMGTCFE